MKVAKYMKKHVYRENTSLNINVYISLSSTERGGYGSKKFDRICASVYI